MIALVQRVSSSAVSVRNEEVAHISRGFNVLLGVLKGDGREDIDKLVSKLVNLRIFADEDGKMNRSIVDIGGEALVISQFTLAANVKKGRRPGFENAMQADEAKGLYDLFCTELSRYISVEKGVFGAMMDVEIHNDGPVTLIVDSREF